MTALKPYKGPGPGNYDVKSMIVEGPSYTLRGRVKILKKSESPGPGQYNPNKSSLEGTYSYGFTKEARKLTKEDDGSPGPGTYEIKEEKSPGIKFGNDSRARTAISCGPGPGEYKLPNTLDSRGFSIAGKVKVKNIERSPGPGVYELKSLMETRSFSIGRSQRFKYFNNQVPGPGSYASPLPKSKSNLVFGTSKRETYTKSEDSPGPGSYTIPQKIVEGPLYTMRAKSQTKAEEKYPGPGEYSIKSNEKIAVPVFGTGKRSYFKNYDSPGPGQYSTPIKEYSRWKFGNDGKLKYKTSDVPGPGAYDIPLF
jgi:hypothetical protein